MKRAAELRDGFTTGSAAAAAAVSAFLRSASPVELILPGGRKTLRIPVKAPGIVVKDGGDDPDVTTGLEIHAEVRPFDGVPESADHVEKSDLLELVIRGGEGVGVSTRPGLAVPPGKYAVNPVPRRMILENLEHAGCRGRVLAVISVPGGRETARKTLNPTLGITGGISILGHSGIVKPYSNAAYVSTIALQLGSIAAGGSPRAALATGNRSAEAVARDFSLPADSVVRIADFIYAAVRSAEKAGLRELLVACMPGKLFKYACGERNTHAHNSRLAPERLNMLLGEGGSGLLSGLPLEKMDTMGELLSLLPEEKRMALLRSIHEKASSVLSEWGGKMHVEVVLYDDTGRRIL